MNTHLRFDDDCVPITTPPCTSPAAEDRSRTLEVIPDVVSGTESDSDFVGDSEDALSSADDDLGSETASECSQRFLVRSHQASPNQYRHNVDMARFTSLEKHLKVLKQMTQAEVTTLNGRVAEFIGWVMNNKQVTQGNAVDIILVGQPLIVVQYVTLLKDKPNSLKNGTIYNILLDLTRWATYLAVYEAKSIDQFVAIAVVQQKHERKKQKIDVQQRLCLENLIQHNHWPANGKRELHRILKAHQSKVDRIIRKCAVGDDVSVNELGFANDWVVSTLFVTNPQGRSQAIETFPVSRLETLQSSTATSNQFKTRVTYGSQSINCNTATYQYLQAYVKHIRPYMMLTTESCSTLFVNNNGRPHTNIGHCVTRFFRSVSMYHITTTNLRAMFETEVHDAMGAGVLSPNECDDVIRNSGHSSSTAHSHYLKRKAEAAGRNAMAVHDKLYAETLSTPSHVTPVDEWYNVADDSNEVDDDEKTTGYLQSRRRRVEWSAAEIYQLTTWVSDYESTKGIDAIKNWASCLSAMQASGVFDAHHLTKVRLREAWRRVSKKANSM